MGGDEQGQLKGVHAQPKVVYSFLGTSFKSFGVAHLTSDGKNDKFPDSQTVGDHHGWFPVG